MTPEQIKQMMRELLQALPSLEPELWKNCHPRMYRHTDNYGSTKQAALALASAIRMMREQPVQPANVDRDIYFASEMIVDRLVPTFFIDKNFFQAAVSSNPPAELEWLKIQLPFEAALLMLPRGVLTFPNGDDLQFIGYARIRKLTPIPRSIPIGVKQLKDDAFIFFTADERGASYGLTINQVQNPVIEVNPDLIDNEEFYDGDYAMKFSDDESTFMRDVQKLAISLLLAMSARPDLVGQGKSDGRHKKTGQEIWTPNIVGRDYRLPAGDSTGEGAAKRFHWRRGHFKIQHYGEKNSLDKIIWVEPYAAGGK